MRIVEIVQGSAGYSDASNQSFSCSVLFEGFDQPLPFTASADDPESHGREIWRRIQDGEAGEVAPFVEPAPPPPAPRDIDAERERRILIGTTVDVSGIGSVRLQGRPEDQINMLALKDTARDLKAAGVTAPVIPFRDGANVIHMMTPDQMIEATDKGKMHVSAVYQAAWDLKGMSPIPADYAEDKWWP